MTIQPPADTKASATAAPPGIRTADGFADGADAAGPPAVVYLLADHLDAVLARGEDLLASSWRPERTARCPATIESHQTMQRDAIRAIRTHELLLISRALKARERARELAAKDGRFAPLARVFVATTASLEDAAREAGDLSAEQFDSGLGILAYMRARGMVPKDSADFDDCGSIIVTPKFLIARRIELDIMLDLVAGFLDAIELHFDIYPETDTALEAQPGDAPIDVPANTDGAIDASDGVPVPVCEAQQSTADAAPLAPQTVATSSLIERLSSAQQL